MICGYIVNVITKYMIVRIIYPIRDISFLNSYNKRLLESAYGSNWKGSLSAYWDDREKF